MGGIPQYLNGALDSGPAEGRSYAVKEFHRDAGYPDCEGYRDDDDDSGYGLEPTGPSGGEPIEVAVDCRQDSGLPVEDGVVPVGDGVIVDVKPGFLGIHWISNLRKGPQAREARVDEPEEAPLPVADEWRIVGDEILTGDDLLVRLDGVRALPETGSDRPAEGSRFPAVRLTFRNLSGESVPVPPLFEGFELRDETNRPFPRPASRASEGGTLEAEGELSTELVHEVAGDARGVRLDYRPAPGGMPGAEIHTWFIGNADEVESGVS